MKRGKLMIISLGATLILAGLCLGQDSLNVTTLAQLYDFWDGVSDLAVHGSTVYIADQDRGLHIMDYSLPLAPVEIGRLPLAFGVNSIVVSGNLLCATGSSPDIAIYDISVPSAPRLVGSCQSATYESQLDLQDNFLYALTGAGILRIFDLSDPAQPELTSSTSLGNYSYTVEVAGDYAYVLASFCLKILDVSDPYNPIPVGSTPAQFTYDRDLKVQGSHVYMASDSLLVVDVSNPASPAQVGSCPLSTFGTKLEVSGSYAYVGGYTWTTPWQYGVSVVDVNNPGQPVETGFAQSDASVYNVGLCQGYLLADGIASGLLTLDVADPQNPFWAAEASYRGSLCDIARSGNTLFLTDEWEGLRVVDVSNPAEPRQVAWIEELKGPKNIVIGGGYAYITNTGQYGMPFSLWVVNISQPEQPLLVDTVLVPVHEVVGMSQSESLLGLAVGYGGVRLYDLTDPAAPVLVGTYFAGEENYCPLVLLTGRVVFAAFSDGLHILDVSNPGQPRLLSILNTCVEGMDRSGNYLYVATGYQGTILVEDVSDLENPTMVSTYHANFMPGCLHYQQGYLYTLSLDYNTNDLHVLDVHDPALPQETGWYIIPDAVNAAAVSGGLAFTAQNHALAIYDCSASMPVLQHPESTPASSFALHSPRPNPFNPSTAISYQLSASSYVSLRIYDTAGRLVATLVDGMREAGTHEVTFDPVGAGGSKLASGIYLARLEAGEFTAVQKMVLMK